MAQKAPYRATRREVVAGAFALHSEKKPEIAIRTAAQAAGRGKPGAVSRTIEQMARAKSAKELRQLRREEAAFSKRLPTPAQWEDFYRSAVLPIVNGLSGNWARCEACGGRFFRSRRGRRFCTDACSSMLRGRGRNVTRSRAQRHFARCQACQSGNQCAKLEAMLPSEKPKRRDALSRKHVAGNW